MNELKSISFRKAKYLTSAASLSQLPADKGAEVAFIGRSNAGKSSAINLITGIKGLARISKTPGRTQMINLFQFEEECRLVDLPGYGYAKVPKLIKARWEKLVDNYLESRQCLKGMMIVMDARHPLKELDIQMLRWAGKAKLPVHILLSKADKLNTNSGQNSLHSTVKFLEKNHPHEISVQLFSSQTHLGLSEARKLLNEWYYTE